MGWFTFNKSMGAGGWNDWRLYEYGVCERWIEHCSSLKPPIEAYEFGESGEWPMPGQHRLGVVRGEVNKPGMAGGR